jgi:hypothetical protein
MVFYNVNFIIRFVDSLYVVLKQFVYSCNDFYAVSESELQLLQEKFLQFNHLAEAQRIPLLIPIPVMM